MTCPATLPGPSHLPCTRPAGHTDGHVYHGPDQTDRTHHDHQLEDQ